MKEIIIAAAIISSYGCSEEPPPPEMNAQPTTPEPVEIAAFEYTETPQLDDVPNTPVAGNANGREIEIQTVVFQPRFDSWSMTLSTAELDRPTGILPGMAEAVNITDLPQELAAGTYTHAIDESGGGFFQIQKPDEEGTTSWNTRMAYVLQITEWNGRPYDPEGSMFQEAGTASGKVVAVFRGNDRDFANSWVAGTFDDAIVRYMGTPRWLRDEE